MPLTSKIKRFLLKRGIFKFDYPPVEVFRKDFPVSRINEQIRDRIIGPEAESYRSILEKIQENLVNFRAIPFKSDSGLCWQNHYYPGLDIMALFTLLKDLRPVRVIEVGSGFSTWTMTMARDTYSLPVNMICIDPDPRTDLKRAGVHFIQKKVQDVDPEIFQQLESGDFLMIDSSHRILPGSDLEFIFENILPELPAGVIVHIHDIYLPYAYPSFMRERLYSEQHLLSQFLYYRNDIEILFPSFYVYRSGLFDQEIHSLFEDLDPRIERHGGAFWFRLS